MCSLQKKSDVPWGGQFDEAIRQAWAKMEDYVQVCYGKDCTDLRLVPFVVNGAR
jgi:hypothetical protein